MTTGLPARVAICAVLTVQLARPVRADIPPPEAATAPASPPVGVAGPPDEGATPERRQVAVIDLSEDEKVRVLSGALYQTINASDTMMVPNKRGFDNYLTGTLFDEDAQEIAYAKSSRTTAQTDLDETDAAGAATAAKTGQAYLAKVVPTTEVQALYADLSFLAGLAALDQGKAQEANLELALTHRLDPARQLDAARYPPDTIAAYKRAIESKPALVAIDVGVDPALDPRHESRVWIDFVDRGPVGSFAGLEMGYHVITVVGSTLVTDGAPQKVTGPITVMLKPAEASPETQVSRARLALSRAQVQHDDAARAGAMKQLAALLGVGDAVMISKRPDGTLQWETWRDRAPGFSPPQAYTTQKPDDILEGLGPLHRPPPRFTGPVPFSRPPIVIERLWYQETWVQASVAATVVAAIVGGILLATRTEHVNFAGDFKDDSSASSAR